MPVFRQTANKILNTTSANISRCVAYWQPPGTVHEAVRPPIYYSGHGVTVLNRCLHQSRIAKRQDVRLIVYRAKLTLTTLTRSLRPRRWLEVSYAKCLDIGVRGRCYQCHAKVLAVILNINRPTKSGETTRGISSPERLRVLQVGVGPAGHSPFRRIPRRE